MEKEDKRIAEAVMRRLCQGAQIDGIRFGPVLQVLITDHSSAKPPIRGQTYLNLESEWAVYDLHPVALPEYEGDIPKASVEEQLVTLCDLRERTIIDVQLGDEQPHLVFHLDDGRTFFINGRHEMYECWQMGVALGDPRECWMVVALPGGGVAVWSPDWFDSASA